MHPQKKRRPSGYSTKGLFGERRKKIYDIAVGTLQNGQFILMRIDIDLLRIPVI